MPLDPTAYSASLKPLRYAAPGGIIFTRFIGQGDRTEDVVLVPQENGFLAYDANGNPVTLTQAEMQTALGLVKGAAGGVALDDLSNAGAQAALDGLNPDTDALSLWRAALSDILRTGSGYASLAFVGDSWCENNRTINPLATLLQQTYGNGGGWIGLVDDTVEAAARGAIGTVSTSGGTWTLNTSGFGPGLQHRTTSTVGARKTFTTRCTSFVLHYLRQSGGGILRYRVDGGAWTSLDTANATSVVTYATVSGLTDATHAIDVECETAGSSGIAVAGIEARRAEAGVRVHKLGRSGGTSGMFAASTTWAPSLAQLAPDCVVILLGTNDALVYAADPSQFATNIATMATNIRAATGEHTSILLVLSAQNGIVDGRVSIETLHGEVLAVAAANNIRILRGYTAVAAYDDISALWANTGHVGTTGGDMLARYVFEAVKLPGPVAGAALSAAETAQVAALIDEAFVLNDQSATFTRATAAFDPMTGVSVASGARRRRWFDLGAGRRAQGDLVEGAATNLLLYSEQLDNAAWTKDADLTVTADAAIAPDNTLTADLAAVGTATDPEYSQAVTITAGRWVIAGVFVKSGATPAPFIRLRVSSDSDANGFQAWFNLSTGAVGTTGEFGTGDYKESAVKAWPLGNGWSFIWVSGKVDTAATAVTFSARLCAADNSTTSAVVGSGVYVWGHQLEAESTTRYAPSSYNKTEGTTVTRNLDALQFSLAALPGSGWGRHTGTLLALVQPLYWSSQGTDAFVVRTSSSEEVVLSAQLSSVANRINGGRRDASGSQFALYDMADGGWAGQPLRQLAVTWEPAAVRTYEGGTLRATDSSTAGTYFNASTACYFGQSQANAGHLNGYAVALYWARLLSSDEISLLYRAIAS